MNKYILLVILILVSSSVNAILDIQPDRLDFYNTLPEKEYVNNIIINSDSNADVIMSAEVSSSLSDFVHLVPSRITLVKDVPLILKVFAKSEVKREGTITLCFTNTDMGMISSGGVKCVPISVSIVPGDSPFKSVIIEDVKIHPSIKGQPFDAEIIVENKGNIDLTLEFYAGDLSYELNSKALNKEHIHIAVDNLNTENKFILPVKVTEGDNILFNGEREFLINDAAKHKLSLILTPELYSEAGKDNNLIARVRNEGDTGVNYIVTIWITQEEKKVMSFEKSQFIGVGQTEEILFEYNLPSGEYQVNGMVEYADTYDYFPEQYLTLAEHSRPTDLAAGGILFVLALLILFVHVQKKLGGVKRG